MKVLNKLLYTVTVFITAEAFLFACAEPQRIRSTIDLPIVNVNRLPLPAISSYTFLGEVTGKGCHKHTDKTPEHTVRLSHISNLSMAEQAAYVNGLNKRPGADLIIAMRSKTIYNPKTFETCSEIRGQAIAISGIASKGTIISYSPATGSASTAPHVAAFGGGVAVKSACNFPIIGALANFATFGIACFVRKPTTPKLYTVCDIPLYGAFFNVFSLGSICKSFK